MSHENRNLYPFQKGLATGQRLEILAADPTLATLALEGLLPPYGQATKPANTDSVGMMVFGAATVLFETDRNAENQIAYVWPLLRPVLERLGISAGSKPPTANNWRYYRDNYLTWEVIADLKSAFRELEVGRALAMGLFPTAADPHDYMVPDHRHTVYADGTWFMPASKVGVKKHKSRATAGSPRLAGDLDLRGKAVGYCHVFTMARLPEERMRLVLDFERARDGKEIPVVLESLARVHSRVGDGLRHFVYDRAFSAHEHVQTVVERGILPITKPAGLDAFSDWTKARGKPWKAGAPRFNMSFDGCVHRMALNHGMLWHMEYGERGLVYAKRADHVSIDRYRDSDGTFGFKIGLSLTCGGRQHRFTVDMTKKNPVVGGERRMGVNLKAHPVADAEAFRGAYSIRSDVESAFGQFKNNMGFGSRAGSFDPRAHEIDLLLLSLVNNALAYAEWRQRYQGRTRAA